MDMALVVTKCVVNYCQGNAVFAVYFTVKFWVTLKAEFFVEIKISIFILTHA